METGGNGVLRGGTRQDGKQLLDKLRACEWNKEVQQSARRGLGDKQGWEDRPGPEQVKQSKGEVHLGFQ